MVNSITYLQLVQIKIYLDITIGGDVFRSLADGSSGGICQQIHTVASAWLVSAYIHEEVRGFQ